MWRVAAICIALLLGAQSPLQGFPPGVFSNKAASDPAGGCSQATTFLARTSGLDGTHTAAYTTLICGLVTDGVWSSLDALYVVATADSTTAGLNLVSTSYTLTAHGTITFSANHGYTGDASTGYLDTGLALYLASNYSLNSGSIGAYVLTNRTADDAYGIMGVNQSGSNYTYLLPHWSDGKIYGNINDSSSGHIYSGASTTAQGMWVVSRTSSTAGAVYLNASSIGSTSSDTAQGVPTPYTIYLGGQNNGGSLENPSSDQFAAAFVGAGLNSTQAAAISNRLNAYMTTFGINVY